MDFQDGMKVVRVMNINMLKHMFLFSAIEIAGAFVQLSHTLTWMTDAFQAKK